MPLAEILLALDKGFQADSTFQSNLEQLLQTYAQTKPFQAGSGSDGLSVRMVMQMATLAKERF